MRFELTTSTLARLRSTPELRPRPRVMPLCNSAAIIRLRAVIAIVPFTLVLLAHGNLG
jgi:hypothetical protein